MPASGIDRSSDADWRHEFARHRLRTLYYLGLIANPVFLLSDFLFYRNHMPTLLALRAALETGFLLVFFTSVQRRSWVPPRMALILWVLIGNLCIAHMTVYLGGFTSAYYSGLNLVFLAAAVIVPVSWPSHLIAQAITLSYYYAINFATPQSPGAESLALQNSFFLIWTCIACLFSVYLYESLQVAEFQARRSERRAREQLEQSHRKLLELDRLKDQFFANINHELRTPLTLSLGALKMLGKLPLQPEAQAIVRSGLRNTSRLLLLINELLELARFESGRAELRTSCVDLAALITNVAANFESSERRRIFLEGTSRPVPARVDVRKMTKVFSNLLMNAFKFSDPELGQVWISLAADSTQASITIRDNGIGIADDQVERIFDRFTQVEGQATRRFEGSGIGLALAKEIVTLHGGQIAVHSMVGEGSTFLVTLPRGDVDAQPIVPMEEENFAIPREVEDHVGSKPHSDAMPDKSDENRPLILVADDNADMRAYLVRLLSRDYRVISAHEGADALQKARCSPPALIVTDIMMPVMSGHELLQMIRRDDVLRAVPVILLTARAGMEARVESLEAGADDYLSKPFHEEELLARIKNQLRIHRQERELEAKATELQQLYSKLERANEELRDASLRKSEFVSIVSHDLRTPLAAMDGYVENLLDGIAGPLTDKQRRYLDRIKSNIGRLVRMINELLDLSKIEAGTLVLDAKIFAIADLADQLIESFQHVAREKDLALRIVMADRHLLVCADQDKLTQVLTNLVQNACKFTPAGGEVRLEIAAGEAGSVQICVADTGCGIPPEETPRIFEKFYRGSSARGEARGVGLGLAIAKYFIELHQGRIWIDSVPGHGSRFYFTVPAARQTVETQRPSAAAIDPPCV